MRSQAWVFLATGNCIIQSSNIRPPQIKTNAVSTLRPAGKYWNVWLVVKPRWWGTWAVMYPNTQFNFTIRNTEPKARPQGWQAKPCILKVQSQTHLPTSWNFDGFSEHRSAFGNASAAAKATMVGYDRLCPILKQKNISESESESL